MRSKALLCCLWLCACAEPTGASAAFSLDAAAGFFGAPFPIAHRARADGTLAVADFPNRDRNALLQQLLEALERSPVGFGVSSAVYFRFDQPLDESTLPPDVASTLLEDSAVYLINVDPQSPRRGERIPLFVQFKRDRETYSPENLLVLLPRPGASMAPNAWHAAIISETVRDETGAKLGRAPLLDALLKGEAQAPAQLVEGFAQLRASLGEDAQAQIRAATVFKTGDPFSQMRALRRWVLQRPAPVASQLRTLRDHERFCVVEGRVTVPLVQDGERPYNDQGGEIRLTADGAPETPSEEEIRFALSIPKAPMPPQGWPLLLYSAGSGGRHTQFVDRGTFEEQESLQGRGPALYLAASGIAALSIEAPLVGDRHPSESYTGLDFFNVNNVYAFRDNIRQAALDFTTLVRMAKTLQVDAQLCPGESGDPFTFDEQRLFFHGHSTGATVGSAVLALEPDLSAGLLTGAGGSWLYNLSIKAAPLDVGALVRSLLGLIEGDVPDLFDPPLNLAQTLWESAEPINWAPQWIDAPHEGPPKNILLIEGVIDNFLPPPSVNALVIAGGLQPQAPTVEDSLLQALAPFGLGAVDAPSAQNKKTPMGDVTGLVVQYAEPPGVDGHYVPFELPGPKYQYRCFFESLVGTESGMGLASVPAPSEDPLGPCP